MTAQTMLVTGAAGFIGSHLVDALLEKGYPVIGVDNMLKGRLENLTRALGHDGFRFIQVDVADEQGLAAALTSPVQELGAVNTVWHLAANSDIPAGVADAQVDFQNTFMTTFNVVNTMRAMSIPRIVFASTSAVYGDLDEVLTETTGPTLPISNYGAMKLAGEAAISAAVESHLQSAVLCRFPNVVGSRSTHGILYDLVGKLLRQPTDLEVLGDGRQCKPYLHVSDLVSAMIHIWSTCSDRRALFNIGPEDDGAEVSFIARAVLNESGSGLELRYVGGDRGWVGDVPRVRYSVDKLKATGWAPTLSSRQAVARAAREVAEERGLLA